MEFCLHATENIHLTLEHTRAVRMRAQVTETTCTVTVSTRARSLVDENFPIDLRATHAMTSSLDAKSVTHSRRFSRQDGGIHRVVIVHVVQLVSSDKI